MSSSLDVAARKPARSWRPSRGLVALFALVVLAPAAALMARGRGSGEEPSSRASFETTAKVERRDLIETESFDGTLGYSGATALVSSGQGTLTHAAREGSRVERGEALYSIDGVAVRLLFGSTPMYRDLASGVSDGPDVEQLEKNLAALGFDPYDDVEIDREWDWATTAAVERWEEELGLAEDGVVRRGEVVFLPGTRVVGEHSIHVGAPVGPGTQILATSSARREISMDVEVGDAHRFEKGARVSIQLPNGDEIGGRVASVGKVATPDPTDSGADPTIAVTVTLTGRARTGGIDQAPVDVTVETDRAREVLAVPVSALLATTQGFALQVVEGSATRMVAVEPGSFADGWVEVDGDIGEGTEVVTAP